MQKNNSQASKTKPIAVVWPISRMVFAGVLVTGLLTLLLLVPPTSVQAERATRPAHESVAPVSTLAAIGGSIDTSTSVASGFQLVEEPANTNLAGIAETSNFAINSNPDSIVELASAENTVGTSSSMSDATEAVAATPVVYEEYIDWKTVKVSRGETLTHMFKKAGLTAADAYELMGRCVEAKRLSKIHPGHELDFEIEDNKLIKLRYRKSVLESHVYRRDGDVFTAETISRIPDSRVQYQKATLEDSLFMAGQRVGLEQGVIMQLASVFGGVIDFVFDPRKGDTFSIMYEDLYLDGEKIGSGNILAAEYINDGDSFTAYRYEDSKGSAGYYAPDGVSMQKAFLRAPLDFKRISSSFNLRRKHPIHKRIKAHRGIDYAAPRGTPVFAAGDGRVVKAGYTKPNGNYIVVSHGPQYTTKYLHLTKRHVKNMSRVKKGQIIGTVGSTGYATGPHLHYEFLVNGVHRNPRTILNKLPKAKSIAADELPRFEYSISSLQGRLAQLQQSYTYTLDGEFHAGEPMTADAGP